MHVTLPFSRRARAGLAAAVAATTLSLVPAVAAPASAAPASVAVECSAAKAALAQAQRQQKVAKDLVVKARKALAKAKKTRRAVKIRRARTVLTRSTTAVAGRTRTVAEKSRRLGYACSAPTSAVRAQAAGKALAILAAAEGLTPGPVDRDQLVALLDRFVPGVAGRLTEAQLNAILAGFNVFAYGSAVSPNDALAMLGGAFSPAQISQLLNGLADPAVVVGLVGHIRTQLGGLATMTPPAYFDPSAVRDILAGIFGNLDAGQLGKLVALLTAIADGQAPTDTAELTAVLDAVIDGISGAFDQEQLEAMLAGVAGGTPVAAVVTNLLGGEFTEAEIGSLLDGTITPEDAELAGAVIAHVVAQLATTGHGDLAPVVLDPTELVDLFESVTGQLQELFCFLFLGFCG